MKNLYKEPLDLLFDRIISLRYNVYRLNNMLIKSIDNLKNPEEDRLISASSLIISDITGPTDNGWTIKFHTGHTKVTLAEGYKEEAIKLISIESCYSFAQTFEGLERFLKDILYQKTLLYPEFFDMIKDKKFTENNRKYYPGGDKLFEFIKKATGESFNSFSQTNNYNLRFSEFWYIISVIRHAITHSQSIIPKSLIFKSKTHTGIFNHFFMYNERENEHVEIVLDYRKFEKLTNSIAEFSFQLYKLLSIQKNFDWEIKD